MAGATEYKEELGLRKGSVQDGTASRTLFMRGRASPTSSWPPEAVASPVRREPRVEWAAGLTAVPEGSRGCPQVPRQNGGVADGAARGAATTTSGPPPPSRGAWAHSLGGCTPCKFFRSTRGCKDGAACKYCHFAHPELTPSGVRSVMRRHAIIRERQALAAASCEADQRRPAGAKPLVQVSGTALRMRASAWPVAELTTAELVELTLFLLGGRTLRL